jgi:hypothetical protein
MSNDFDQVDPPVEERKPALDLSLYQLEKDLADLIEYRQDRLADTENRPTEEEIAALDAEIQRYEIAEPAKVSGVVAIIRKWKTTRETAEAERKRLKAICTHLECMEERLKSYLEQIVDALPKPKKGAKKLVGKDGSTIMLKGNGGLAPMIITDPAAIPDELKVATIRMPARDWYRIARENTWIVGATYIEEHIEPDNGAIRAELDKECPDCEGGFQYDASEVDEHTGSAKVTCPTCGGSAKNAIPGARLEPRGQHIEVK